MANDISTVSLPLETERLTSDNSGDETSDVGDNYSQQNGSNSNTADHSPGKMGGNIYVPVVDFDAEKKSGIEKTADKDGNLQAVSFFQMFRYADGVDKGLLFIGTLAAICNGMAYPINFLVYGEVATGFIFYTQLQTGNSSNPNLTSPFNFNVDEYQNIFDRTKIFVVYFCLIAVSVIVVSTVQHVCWRVAAERQIRTIKKTFVRSVLHQDIAWYDVHDTGALTSTLNEEMQGFADGIGRELSMFIQWLSTGLGSYAVALIKGWKLALACLTFSPLLMVLGGVLIRIIKNISTQEAKAYSEAGTIAEESLSAIKTVMAFNGQDKECQRYNKCLNKAADSSTSKGVAMGIALGFVWFILYCVMSLGFWYATKLMSENEPGFEPGSVLTIFFCVIIGSVSVGQIFPVLETLGGGKAAAASIFSVIDQKPTIQHESSKGDNPVTLDGNLEFKNVRFTYPARPDIQVLKDLSFQVQKGQTVALVGNSGCGKSTIVQLVERFYDVQEGQILLDGRNIQDLNVRWLRDQIGLVSQEPVLFGITIGENIKYGRMDVTWNDIKQAAIKANAHDFIAALPKGYGTLVGDRGAQLSGGQKQRIAIARALVRDPKILLLDEATSALDNESEAVVQQALEKAQEGRTTLVIAHRLSTIQNADQIIVMRDGEFVEQGQHSELMQKMGLYHKLVENQLQTDKSEIDGLPNEMSDSFQKSPLFGTDDVDTFVLDTNEIGMDEKSPLTVRRRSSKFSRTTSVKSRKMSLNYLPDEEGKEDLLPFSMKRILLLNSPEWCLLTIGCLIAVVLGATQPILAYLLGEFLTIFTAEHSSPEDMTVLLVAISVSVGLANVLLRVSMSWSLTRAGSYLTRRVRSMTFESMVKQDMTFYDDPRHRVGLLTTRLSNDATEVQGAAGSKVGIILESVSTLIASITVAMVTSWKLSLATLAFMPLIVGMGVTHGRLVSGYSKSDKESLVKAGQIVSESVDNIRLVQSLSREETFQESYNVLINATCRKAIHRSIVSSVVYSLSTSVMYFTYAATFAYGAYLIEYEGLNFHLVFRCFTAILFGGISAGRNSSFAPDFARAKIACQRLFSLVDIKPRIDISNNEGSVMEQCSGRIDFRDVTFHYPARPEVRVLHDLGFTVMPGQTVALVGTSGCGKSTTVSLIERFYDPVLGSVRLDQEDLHNLNLKWLRSQIGFVSQEPVLFDCTIAENIAYGDNSRVVPMDEIIASARSANIHSFITSLPEGYETNVGSKGTQLSGGQKQRVAIARALVSNPKILLLDEATSALDSESEKVVQAALDKAREGRTSLVIAHRLSTIQNADKIVIFHKGAIVESGTHAELLARKQIYYKLTQIQNRHKKIK